MICHSRTELFTLYIAYFRDAISHALTQKISSCRKFAQLWKSPAYRLHDRKLAEIDAAPSALPANYFHTKSPRANLIFWERKINQFHTGSKSKTNFWKIFVSARVLFFGFVWLALRVFSSTLSLKSIHEAISEIWICMKLIIFALICLICVISYEKWVDGRKAGRRQIGQLCSHEAGKTEDKRPH